MFKKPIKILLTYFVLYLLDFVIIPFAYVLLYGANSGRLVDESISYIIIFAVFVIGMEYITDCFTAWLACMPFYIFLMFVYVPRGIYGIGISGIFHTTYNSESVPFGIMIVALSTLFIAFIAWIFVKVGKKLG